MHIERVQRWVVSAVVLTVAYVWATGLVLGALYTIDEERDDAQAGLFVMAAIICAVGVTGVRLINRASLMTPWMLTALLPTALGVVVLTQR
ncbi:MAG: hypothetical protein ACRDO2_12275 [Nocardioidaceae bacterium]